MCDGVYGTVVASVHDSILVEIPKPKEPYHWLEDGTEDEIKWNILNSDLPWLMLAMMGSGQFGSPMWRALQGAADVEVPLMGTYIVDPAYHQMHGHAVVVHDLAGIERRVMEMLLNRPEVKNEPAAKALIAAAQEP